MNNNTTETASTLKAHLLLSLRRLGNVLSFGGSFPLMQVLLRRCFRHAHGTILVRDFDGDLSIGLRLSEHMQRRIFWTSYYNRRIVSLISQLLRPGMIVIDVGANIGEISMTAAKRVGGNGRVIAFEPIDKIADELQANIDRNRLNQIIVERLGLSDTFAVDIPVYASCGQGTAADEHHGLGSLFGASTGQAPVQHISTTTLDNWIADHQIARVDLIKVDVEGAELMVLKGAKRTLQQFKPALIVEVQETTATTAGYRARDILDYLAALGYAFHRIGRAGVTSVLSIDNLEPFQNVLCVPMRVNRA